MAFRCDRGTLANAKRTPQGGLRIPAHLTRVGVFVYRKADGSTQRELRLPTEVFSQDSLATLAGAPVTDLHPAGVVTPANWRQVTIGHVGEQIKADGKFVTAEIAIQDAMAIVAIEKNERKELSCGYDCDVEFVSGVHDGERYDAIQRNIRYNHVAIGPQGWGRAGKDVSLRLDSGDALQIEDAGNVPETEKGEPMKIKIDGIDYEAGSSEFCQAYDRYIGKLTSDLAAQTKRADSAEGKLDTVTKELDSAKKALTESNDPKRIDSLVRDRATLVTKAVAVLGAEYKPEGKADRDIMVDTIRHDAKDFDPTNRSDDYIRGRFESLTVPSSDAPNGPTVQDLGRATGGRKDTREDNAPDADKSRAAMIEANRKAATLPMAFSKDARS